MSDAQKKWADVGYAELARRLSEIGLPETEGSVTVKINRGGHFQHGSYSPSCEQLAHIPYVWRIGFSGRDRFRLSGTGTVTTPPG
ncbi:DUF6471 domain-containing protein [Acidiphilium iwatense]|uniref:DUF6471 domain-containing protein n=1 Tax=Acidiphilium iwatense TaxID=768198 RepID=UPI0038B2E3B2